MMLRKVLSVALVTMLAAGVAQAQLTVEPIPETYIQQFAAVAVGLFQQQFPNPPVKVDPDSDKVLGFHSKEKIEKSKIGTLIFPDKNLTLKLIDEAGDKEVPVCVLATLALSLEANGRVVPSEDLSIADLNGQLKLPLFFLSLKSKDAEKMLVVYSKEGKPIETTTLKKLTGEPTQGVGLKLANIDEEKRKLDATVTVLGTYETTLKLAYLKL